MKYLLFSYKFAGSNSTHTINLVNFLKSYTFGNIITFAILTLVLGLPYFLIGAHHTISTDELRWLVIGEKVHANNFAIYTAVWDTTSPLASLLYGFLDVLGGRWLFLYRFLTIMLLFATSLLWNAALISQKTFTERTLIPAILFILLSFAFFDLFTLSPLLLSLPFLLVAIRYTFNQIDESLRKNFSFEIGFYIGMASLFYLPTALILAIPIISFMLFTGLKVKDYIVICFAFIFPWIALCIILYLLGDFQIFYTNYVYSLFSLEKISLISWKDIAFIFLLPFLITLMGVMKATQSTKYINYQVRCQVVMLFWLIASCLIVLLDKYFSPADFLILMPGLAFFMTHYFLLAKKKWLREGVFFLLLFVVLIINYGNLYEIMPPSLSIQTSNLKVKKIEDAAIIQGKKILILGDNISGYNEALLASPFINFSILKRDFIAPLNNYEISIDLYKDLQKDFPKVIIDEKQVMPKVFEQLPLLAKEYKKEKNNLYIKR